MSRPIRIRELCAALLIASVLLLPGLGAHTLVDPWEGHYAEVGRRILQDDDWVRLAWKNESFRSKPVLAPWLIAASLRAHGLAAGGGYSGELATAGGVAWAVRLPFALFGIGALLALWWMLARLVSLRAAWLGLMTCGAAPFYVLVSRQAITDIPMIATTVGAVACFAVAILDGERPLRRLWWRFNAWHIWFAALAIVVGVQVLYNALYFAADPALGPGIRTSRPVLWSTIPFAVGMAAVAAIGWRWKVRTHRQLLMLCAYVLVGVSILAKGPPGAALVGVLGVSFVVVTRQWRLLARVRLVDGLIVVLLVAAPWHLAMALRDGQPWITEYIGHHWLKRAGEGVHAVNSSGEGTFAYYLQQLGIGVWPLVAFVPAALLSAMRGGVDTTRDRVRLLALLWVFGGLFLFTAVETKFHHYILPIVPGLAILIALYFEDLLSGRARGVTLAVAGGVVLSALVAWDIVTQQERLLELFVYRYDRPWPGGSPWHLDMSRELLVFGVAFSGAAALVCVAAIRRYAVAGVLTLSIVFSFWTTNRYMRAVAPHWGQGQLHATYYALRQVHGVELHYARASDWTGSITFRCAIPAALRIDDPMTVTIVAGGKRTRIPGRVEKISGSHLTVRAPVSAPGERDSQPRSPLRTIVDADRLITWNLFWRSEIFWSGGELWGPTTDTKTAFGFNNDKGFARYIARPESANRRFYLITATPQLSRLRSMLPPSARSTVEVLDRSSNKFILVRFAL